MKNHHNITIIFTINGLQIFKSRSKWITRRKNLISAVTNCLTMRKRLYEFYENVEQAPLTNDLTHGPIAYIGTRRLILEELEK